jgi:hypothetical protein
MSESGPRYGDHSQQIDYDSDMPPLSTRAAAMHMVYKERDRQDSKWGEQNHQPPIWMGILGEEYGELCQTVNETVFDNGPEERAKGGRDNMMREACQVAAVAVSFMEYLMRNGTRTTE